MLHCREDFKSTLHSAAIQFAESIHLSIHQQMMNILMFQLFSSIQDINGKKREAIEGSAENIRRQGLYFDRRGKTAHE